MGIWWLGSVRAVLRGVLDGKALRSGIRVLNYHGVVERKVDPVLERNFLTVSQFREHLLLLRRCRLLSLGDLLGELERPERKCGVPIMITFDDGYANNLVAAEILHRFRIPWTLFVSTGALGKSQSLWTTELALLLLHGRASQIEADGETWPLHSREERRLAFQAIRQRLKQMAAPKRRLVLEELRQQFPAEEAKRLLSRFSSLQMLTWEEICQLASSGVYIGSHGVDHEIHHADQPEAIRRRELSVSKQEIERWVGKPCIAFAYPNGDFIPESESELQHSGYQLGFTLVPRTVTRGTSPWYLPRITPRGSLQSLAEDLF